MCSQNSKHSWLEAVLDHLASHKMEEYLTDRNRLLTESTGCRLQYSSQHGTWRCRYSCSCLPCVSDNLPLPLLPTDRSSGFERTHAACSRLCTLQRCFSLQYDLCAMAPRILTIGDIRVTNFTAPPQNPQQLPCCSFELGMARVSTTTVRCARLTTLDIFEFLDTAAFAATMHILLPHSAATVCSTMSDGPSIDTVFGKHGSLYIAFDPQAQGSAHLRVHLYSGNVPRPGNIMGLGSVSLVAAVQAGAVSVHLLDRFGQVETQAFAAGLAPALQCSSGCGPAGRWRR